MSLSLIALLLAAQSAQGGFCRAGFRNAGVGGVSINPEGVVKMPTREELGLLARSVKESTAKTPDAMSAPVGLRKISLKKLEAAIRDARAKGHAVLPDEISFLAGLQRIEYIFVDPAEHDIIIAGPGEGWMVNEQGIVVGVTTGRPVMRLDDFLVALRSASAARTETISVSIDPTDEGRAQLDRYLSSVKTFSPAVVAQIPKKLGPQQVKFTGIPTDSHFARVMLAADVYMKRYALQLEPTPVKAVPSYLQMLKSSGGHGAATTPRWWLECNYEALGRSDDGLSWHLRGPGVKAMTEEELFAGGKITGTGETSPLAKKWADLMTEHYEEFSVEQPVFGELRNLMDMSVSAALIQRENLLDLAGLELPALLGDEGAIETLAWHSPKSIDTECSFIRAGGEWIITASGGVEMNTWQVASRSEVEEQTVEIRKAAIAADKTAWWWN
jgi:hypothetical protein